MKIATTIVTVGKIEVMLWLHTREMPSIPEWDLHIGKLREASERRGGDMKNFVSLVFSDGGHPNARERKIIFSEIFGGGQARFAAVSIDLKNPVLRGVATVIAWLQPGFGAYPPNDIAGALAHVGLTESADRVISEFETLQREMPKNRTLELAKEALSKQSRVA